MTERNFKPGDRVEVTIATEVICVRPDGQVLLKMIGMPVPVEKITKMKWPDGIKEPDETSS